MKKSYLFFLIFLFCVFHAFAQSGINETELNNLVKNYFTNVFGRYLQTSEFQITDLSFMPDWNVSNNEIAYYNVNGKFSNFLIINRILSGRMETRIAVRRQTTRTDLLRQSEVIENVILDSDNKDNVITLLINNFDKLDEMISGYIIKNYQTPVGIEIKYEHFADSINSYVSFINNGSIVYLRIILENSPIEQQVSIFQIKEDQWQLKRA